jgi:hypothetical protein
MHQKSPAKLVAEAIADSAMALGIRDRPDPIADEIHGLIELPFDWFRQHSNWPSGLSESGVPFEFSVAINHAGSASIRYAVDCTDHRQGLAGNWNRYLDYAARAIGFGPSQPEKLWSLLGKHLDGISPLFRTPLLYGVGYGTHERRRASLYFNTRWMSHPQLKKRLIHSESKNLLAYVLDQYGSSQPPEISGVAYDFDDRHQDVITSKVYTWLNLTERTEVLADLAGNRPDLYAAGKVFDRFFASAKPYLIPRSLLLQARVDHPSARPREKVLFWCPAWGWNQPPGLAALLTFLTDTFGMNLGPVEMVLRVFHEYDIPLSPSFVTIGPGTRQPSVAFYFCPMIDTLLEPALFSAPGSASEVRGARVAGESGHRPVSQDSNGEMLDEMLEAAVDYLLRARQTDGHWSDFQLDEPDGRWVDYRLEGRSDEWATAYICSILSADPTLQSHLTGSLEWLQTKFRQGIGWGWNGDTDADADSTALAILALQQMPAGVSEDARVALLRYRLPSGGYRAYPDWNLDYEHGDGAPEVTAVVLLAQLHTGVAERSLIDGAVSNLLSLQREDGGWNAFWWKDDLFATYRVIRALSAFIEHARSEGAPVLPATESAANRVQAARRSLSAQAITNEPFLLGLWLSSWFAAQGSMYHTCACRILHSLRSQQQKNGRWLPVPSKRIARTKLRRPWARSDSGTLYLDSDCLITTATVVDGLLALRRGRRFVSAGV